MKKFTLFLVAALLMTVTSMAQKPAAREFSPNRVAALAPSLKANAKKMPSQASLQKQVDPSRLRAARAVLAGKGQKAKVSEQASKDSKGVLRAPKKTITGDEEFITEQPEGRQQIYSRSGDAYYVNLFWLVQTSFTGAVGNVVFGENNEVYVKNIFSQLPTNSWVKGTLNGSKIVFEFPQMAFEQEGDSEFGPEHIGRIGSQREGDFLSAFDRGVFHVSTYHLIVQWQKIMFRQPPFLGHHLGQGGFASGTHQQGPLQPLRGLSVALPCMAWFVERERLPQEGVALCIGEGEVEHLGAGRGEGGVGQRQCVGCRVVGGASR